MTEAEEPTLETELMLRDSTWNTLESRWVHVVAAVVFPRGGPLTARELFRSRWWIVARLYAFCWSIRMGWSGRAASYHIFSLRRHADGALLLRGEDGDTVLPRWTEGR